MGLEDWFTVVEFMVEETKKISSGKGCPLVSLTASNHLVLVEDVAPPAGDKVAKKEIGTRVK